MLNKQELILSPCPFCGDKDIEEPTLLQGDGYKFAYAMCNQCFIKGPEMSHALGDNLVSNAVIAWNTRA